jgi:hypothetical protein
MAMPGQIEWMKLLAARRAALFAELARTADPGEREILYGKLREVSEDIAEWGAQTERDAESGDQEARAILDAADTMREDDETE